MATPIFTCGMECGVDTAHLTISGTASFTTTNPINGTRSLRCNPTAGTGYGSRAFTSNSNIWVYRFAVRFDSLPTADTYLAPISIAGGHCGAFFQQSDSKLYAKGSSSAVGASGIAVTTGQRYVIDVKVNTTANPWTVDVQVDGVAVGQATHAAAATTDNDLLFGITGTCTADVYFDDLIVSNTSGDYPIGNGKVLAFRPTGDGTHTSTGTNIVKGTTATPVGSAITSATTDAYQSVDEAPLGGGGDFHNQQTTAATEYTEVTFENTVELTAPRAVEVLSADHSPAAGSAAAASYKLYDNLGSTEDTVITRTVSSDTIRYASKQYATRPAALGAWTLDAFNDLRFRFGYSTDANPDHYFDGVLIEAEFVVSAPPAGTGGTSRHLGLDIGLGL